MRHPMVLVCEHDGRLAAQLRDLCAAQKWALREPRQLDHCRRLLDAGHPSVLVLRVGAKVEQELTLLEQAHTLMPALRIVAVSDVENETLAELAWDLGASCALFPPLPRETLPDIVRGLMQAAINELRSGVASSRSWMQPPECEAAKTTPDEHFA